MKKVEDLLDFEDDWNPRQFYCRLRELEISKRRARKYSERYELEIYRPLIRDLRIIRKENLKI